MRKEYDFGGAKRGAVIPTPPGKTRITIRLDDDILEWFREQVHRAGGGNGGGPDDDERQRDQLDVQLGCAGRG